MAEYTAFTDAPAYTESSVVAESSRVVNFRREPLLSGQGKNKFALLRQPGLLFYGQGSTANSGGSGFSRGMIVTGGPATISGPFIGSATIRAFDVIGAHLCEILPPPLFGVAGGLVDWSLLDSFNLANDNMKVFMAASPTQLAIVSAGNLYVFTLATNAFQQVTVGLIGTPNCISYLDGFFVLTFVSSTQYQISAANDATTWDPTQETPVTARGDYLINVHELKERLWFFGSAAIESVYNAGAAPFPFLTDISSVYNYGLVATATVEQLGDSIYFLGSSHSGEGVGGATVSAYKIAGSAIQTISNPAIDSIWSTYQNRGLASAWCYQENGHPCWRITFPNIDGNNNSRTWEYDDSLGPVMGWTETPYYINGAEQAHLGFCSCSAFGLTFVGSRISTLPSSGSKVYTLNSSYLTDDGTNIRRVRRTPHLYNASKRIFLDRIEFDGNKGIGLQVVQGQPYWMAQSTLQVSYDGGRTFPNAWQLSWGKDGDRKTKPYKAHMGSGYDVVLELVCSDPVDWMISACNLDTQLGSA